MNVIKKIIEQAKDKWVQELPRVLWAYRTTSQKVTNKTPYYLAFDFETVIPLEVGLPPIVTKACDYDHNAKVLAWALDLAIKKRKCTHVNGSEGTHQNIQLESSTQRIFSWRPCFDEGYWEY